MNRLLKYGSFILEKYTDDIKQLSARQISQIENIIGYYHFDNFVVGKINDKFTIFIKGTPEEDIDTYFDNWKTYIDYIKILGHYLNDRSNNKYSNIIEILEKGNINNIVGVIRRIITGCFIDNNEYKEYFFNKFSEKFDEYIFNHILQLLFSEKYRYHLEYWLVKLFSIKKEIKLNDHFTGNNLYYEIVKKLPDKKDVLFDIIIKSNKLSEFNLKVFKDLINSKY